MKFLFTGVMTHQKQMLAGPSLNFSRYQYSKMSVGAPIKWINIESRLPNWHWFTRFMHSYYKHKAEESEINESQLAN